MDELGFHRALHRPGLLLDVGAHDGAFTRPFAALPGSRVLAFEPLPSAFARLEAALAPCPAHVTLRRAALGDAPGEFTLTVPVVQGVPQEQWASIAKGYAQHDGVEEQRHSVSVITLDSLSLTDLTHVKLDAEGAEYEVLRGARETLTRCRPVLSVEIEERHRPGSTHAVPAFLDGLGYEGFWQQGGEWRPMASLDRQRLPKASPNPSVFEHIEDYIFVFYFLPREHALAMLARIPAQPG